MTGAFSAAVDRLLTYQIFAPNRLIARVCTEDHRISLGATIVQRVVWGPLAIETAVRVIEFEQTPHRAYFSYATLRGHTERGIASFAVAQEPERIKFEAQAWSRPGNWLSRIGRPLSRAVQKALTREAVRSFGAAA